MTETLLNAENLCESFWLREGLTKPELVAVDSVSFSVRQGETFAVVGESRSGKTMLAMLIIRLLNPDAQRQDIGIATVYGGR